MAEDPKKKMKGEATRFFSIIDAFRYCKVVALRTVVVRSKLREWACIGLVGLFKTNLSPSRWETIFESEDIFIEEQVIDVQSLRGIIDRLIETEFVDTKVGKVKFGGSNARLTNLHFNDRAGYVLYLDEQFGSVTLEGFASVEGELYDSSVIELQLQSLRKPYEGLWDLTLEKVGERFEPARSPSITIRAPRYLKMEATFEEDKLIVHLKAHKEMDLSNFKLTAIVREEKKYPAISRLELPLTNLEPHNGDLVKVVNKLDAKNANSARIFLFQQTEKGFTRLGVQDAYKVAPRTPRSLIHQYLDPDFTTLETWLAGGGKDRSNDFEWAVSLLLSTLGFSAEWTGSDFEVARSILLRRSSGVDIVAFTHDNSVIILGQCTTTKPPSEKVGQLKITSNKLKEKLKNTAIDIIPTVFTLLDEDIIKDEIEQLRKEDIVVIGRQSIDKLLTDVRVGTKLESIISSVFRRTRIAWG